MINRTMGEGSDRLTLYWLRRCCISREQEGMKRSNAFATMEH